jgi:hypothetical protein
MNCDVPCFWGIIPGKTLLSDARIFFSNLGFTPFEGINQNSGVYFYSIGYESDSGDGFSVTFYPSGDIIENILLTPHIPKPKEGSPREWIAYSPETLIGRYGSPARVQFWIGWQQSVSVEMIMYFDTSDLIVHYVGVGIDPDLFCPLTAPFYYVRLWMGQNPPDTPSFETVPLEKATALTMDQFTQLMLGDPQKACFTLNGDAFP